VTKKYIEFLHMIYSSLEFDWSEKKKLALYHDIVSTKNAGLGVKFVD